MRWASAGNLTVQGIQFLTTIVLTRLLEPRAFGLAAVAISIVAFAQLLTDLGLNSALIQTDKLDMSLVRASVLVNVASGLALTALLWELAPEVGTLYHQKQLVPVVRLASVGFTVATYATHLGLLERAMRFRLLIILEVFSALLGSALAVTWAASGGGARAIVAAPVCTAAIFSCLVWSIYPFSPIGKPSKQALAALIRKGGGPTVFNVINYWARNADNLALAFVVSPAQLGFYSRAYNFMMAPIIQVTGGVSRTLLPAMAADRRASRSLSRTYLRGTVIACAAMFPVAAYFAASARSVVLTLFGRHWLPMAPMLTILAVSIPPQILTGTSGAVYQAASCNRELVRRGAVSSGLTVLAILVGLPWGAIGVCWAILIRSFVLLPYNLRLVLRIADVTWWGVTRALLPLLPGCVVMTGVCVLLGLSHLQAPVVAVLGGAIGGAGYVALTLACNREVRAVVTSNASLRRILHKWSPAKDASR